MKNLKQWLVPAACVGVILEVFAMMYGSDLAFFIGILLASPLIAARITHYLIKWASKNDS